jgi:hypothetical protein
MYVVQTYRVGIFTLLRSPEIDSKESIPPAYVAWRAGKTALFLLGSYPGYPHPHRCSRFRSRQKILIREREKTELEFLNNPWGLGTEKE